MCLGKWAGDRATRDTLHGSETFLGHWRGTFSHSLVCLSSALTNDSSGTLLKGRKET